MKINRRDFLKSFGAMAVGAGAITIGNYNYNPSVQDDSPIVVEKVEIPLKNLAPALEGFRIVQLSDLHLQPYTKIELIQQAVNKANALKPDLIVLTGDYVTRKAEPVFELAPALSALNAKYGVFSILGNHDLWTNVEAIKTGFKEAGLPLLQNRGLSLGIGQSTLYLAGVDDGWSGQPDLEAALSNQPADATTILLAHEPDLADTFSLDGRVALQLSGHSHGGQVRIPGFGAPVLPTLGRKYDQGLFNVNDMWLYTNRGIGLVFPVRINCPPEITEITLVSA
jgi:predicted MPP superfamily phosphohydrolase